VGVGRGLTGHVVLVVPCADLVAPTDGLSSSTGAIATAGG